MSGAQTLISHTALANSRARSKIKIMPKFTRPPSHKFPQLYATFKARDDNDEEDIDFLIQELPAECFDEALDLLLHEYMPDEALHACRGLTGVSTTARDEWRKRLAAQISIGCFKSDGSDLVGVSVLGVVSKDDNENDEDEDDDDEELVDVRRAMKHIRTQHDVFGVYGVEEYLTAFGLVVARGFRQRGIGGELIKASVDVAQTLGLKVTSSVFSAIASQKAAEKAGYSEVFVMSYEELAEEFLNFDFSSVADETIKIMDFVL